MPEEQQQEQQQEATQTVVVTLPDGSVCSMTSEQFAQLLRDVYKLTEEDSTLYDNLYSLLYWGVDAPSGRSVDGLTTSYIADEENHSFFRVTLDGLKDGQDLELGQLLALQGYVYDEETKEWIRRVEDDGETEIEPITLVTIHDDLTALDATLSSFSESFTDYTTGQVEPPVYPVESMQGQLQQMNTTLIAVGVLIALLIGVQLGTFFFQRLDGSSFRLGGGGDD